MTSSGAIRLASGAALIAVLALAAACRPEAPAAPPALIRLTDRLPEARIATPFDGVEPAASVEALPGRVRAELLLDRDFERGGDQGMARGCGVVEGGPGPPGARAARCQGGAAFALPAEPLRTYRIRAKLRAVGEACRRSEVRVLEQGEVSSLLLHAFASLRPDAWSAHELLLKTTPETRAVYLRFRNPTCEHWVDDLRVEELRLTRDQELALLAGRGERTAGPLLRRGRQLPIDDPSRSVPPRDDNFTVRDALFAPAPSDLRFELVVPDEARLHFAYGLARESRVGDRAEFVVVARSAAGETELFRDTLRLEGVEDWIWHHATVDLSAFAGELFELTLSTRAPRPSRGYALWGSPYIVRPRAPDDPPNVILIAADTLRADRLSSYGYTRPTSPALDVLAADAIRFDQAISASNWTGPAFHALFTGLSATETSNRVPVPHETLAEILGAAGWVTQAFAYKPSLFDKGFDQGFDGFFNIGRTSTNARHNVAKAVAWLDRHGDERFFLFLHLNDPHQPFAQPKQHPPQELRERMQAFGLELPLLVDSGSVGGCSECSADGRVRPEVKRIARDLYDDAVRYTDAYVGAFLARLERRGLYQDAVLAFVSDHGEMLWEHEEYFPHAGSGLYDALVRVPLLLRPPRIEPSRRGQVVRTQVRLADVAPTLLELAGLEAAASRMDAQSLLPLIESAPRAAAADSAQPVEPGAPADRPALFRGEGSVGLRAGGWKYVRVLDAAAAPGAVPGEQLFDLRRDPGETRNRADSEPVVVARMRQELVRHLLESRSAQSLLVSGTVGERRVRLMIRARGPARLLPELSHPPMGVEGPAHIDPLVVYEGPLEGPLLALAQFRVRGETTYEVTLSDPEDAGFGIRRTLRADAAETLRPGDLEALAHASGPDVRLFGPPPAPAPQAPSTLDARNLEALRALGYLDP